MPNNRKPSRTKELEGNRSRVAIHKPLPLQGLPEMPDGLNVEGEKFWRLVAGELGSVGVAKRIDGPALHMAAQAWQSAQEAYGNQDMGEWCKAVDRWLKFSAKLGLTPADRERLTIAATDPASEEDQFFRTVG